MFENILIIGIFSKSFLRQLYKNIKSTFLCNHIVQYFFIVRRKYLQNIFSQIFIIQSL